MNEKEVWKTKSQKPPLKYRLLVGLNNSATYLLTLEDDVPKYDIRTNY